MPAKRGSAAWKKEYCDVLIGVHMPTRRVRRIYIQNDGTMAGDFSHHPLPGRSAEHEAVVVYELSKVQRFPLFLTESADKYQQQLRDELAQEPGGDQT